MTVKAIIHSKFTAAELNSYLNTLKGSPWSSKRRKDWSGFMWYHGRCNGSIRIRTTKTLTSGRKKIYITAVGGDDGKLISEFIEWIFTHFRNKLVEIRIKPKRG